MKGSYQLTEQAKKDLRRICKYSLITFGETRANKYYLTLISHFDKILRYPYLYQTVDSHKA